jgi:hypothetical protein
VSQIVEQCFFHISLFIQPFATSAFATSHPLQILFLTTCECVLASKSLNILEQSWKMPGHWNFWGTVCWTSAGYFSSLDPLFSPFNSIRPLSRVWTNDSLLSVHIIINHPKKNLLLKAFPTTNICWDIFEFYRWNLIKEHIDNRFNVIECHLINAHNIILIFPPLWSKQFITWK